MSILINLVIVSNEALGCLNPGTDSWHLMNSFVTQLHPPVLCDTTLANAVSTPFWLCDHVKFQLLVVVASKCQLRVTSLVGNLSAE